MTPAGLMQSAVDVVLDSPHPTSKVAAALRIAAVTVTHTNYWPQNILDHFGMDTDIGSSSGTLHAEIACILSAASQGLETQGAEIAVTDPLCPNCAKNIAEAGITRVYIDHKGFEKDFAVRRGTDFENMSIQILNRAGISIYEIRRKEDRIIPISVRDSNYSPSNDSPVIFCHLDTGRKDETFRDMIRDTYTHFGNEPFALAFGRNRDEQPVSICAKAHLAIGYTRHEDAPELREDHGKYSFTLEPANRVLMNAARLGVRLDPEYFYVSLPPTSRESVNLVGAGIKTLSIGQRTGGSDPDAARALTQLSETGIMTLRQLS